MSGDGTGETTARIEVGGKGHGTTSINHFAPTSIGFLQSKGCQRKKGRHNSLVGHGADVRIRSMQQMVGRDGRKFSSQSGTPNGTISSAWSFKTSPISLAASKRRRDCSMEKTPCSQKTSQNSAKLL